MDIRKSTISRNAIRVIDQLRRNGFEAYIVGGAVRDLVLGLEPKDFDIATSATPAEIRGIMRNTRIIGRRFRLVHAYFADEIIEVSTFRKLSSDVKTDENGRLISDNVFGTSEEDAWRRDFTANALFLNPKSGEIIDYTNGLEDLEKRQLRIIGDPDERYCEDPVRMVRAMRLATKLSLKLERTTSEAIVRNKELIANVPRARLFDELAKIIKNGHSARCFDEMERFGMAMQFFPHYDRIPPKAKDWIRAAMLVSDRRQHRGETVSVTIIIASVFWSEIEDDYLALRTCEKSVYNQCLDLFRRSGIHTCKLFGKRTVITVLDVWRTMARMENVRSGKQVCRLRYDPSLRMALAFLRLRAEFDESLLPLVLVWDEISECNEKELTAAVERLFPSLQPPSGSGRRKRRRRKPAEENSQEK